MNTELREGWAFTGTSRKCHFFGEDGRSLCGKWGFRGAAPQWPADAKPSPDDCVECRRRLMRREEEETHV